MEIMQIMEIIAFIAFIAFIEDNYIFGYPAILFAFLFNLCLLVFYCVILCMLLRSAYLLVFINSSYNHNKKNGPNINNKKSKRLLIFTSASP